MIIVLAVYLGNREGRLDSLTSVLGACVLMAPAVILVMLQPDLGSSLVLAAILAGMLFMSGASLRWLIAMAIGVLAAIPLAWTYVLRDYQKDRILSYLNPSADVAGLGLAGRPVADHRRVGRAARHRADERRRRPVASSCRSRRATSCSPCSPRSSASSAPSWCSCCSRRCCGGSSRAPGARKDPFGTLFGAGLASMLLFQVFVNVGMVIGLLPVTGIPLPFITPRWRVARQHRHRPRRDAEREHPPATGGVVGRPETNGMPGCVDVAPGDGERRADRPQRRRNRPRAFSGGSTVVDPPPVRAEDVVQLDLVDPPDRRAVQPLDVLDVRARDLAQRPAEVASEVQHAPGRVAGRRPGAADAVGRGHRRGIEPAARVRAAGGPVGRHVVGLGTRRGGGGGSRRRSWAWGPARPGSSCTGCRPRRSCPAASAPGWRPRAWPRLRPSCASVADALGGRAGVARACAVDGGALARDRGASPTPG